MKNLKKIYSLLVVLVAGLFASCVTDPYTPGEVPAGPQVYFSNENDTIKEVSGDPKDDIQTIVLSRMVADKALDVHILAVAGDNAALFEVPSKVTFAEGEKVANLEIKVKSSEMEEDKEYPINLIIADDKQSTPYGDSQWNVTFKLFPWTIIETKNAEFGKFRGGDALSALYDVSSVMAEVDVRVYQHKSKEGMYMVEDPWLKSVVASLGIESEAAAAEAGFTHTKSRLIINCVDPTKCYIEKQNLGLTISYGELMISSDYHPESNPTGIAGTLEDGVLTFPVGGILAGASKFEGGTMYKSNLSGAFRLVLPGCTAFDYTLDVDYLGIDISPNLKHITTKFTINYGDDVEGLKYYFAEGNVLADPENAINALINGTATDIREIESFSKGGKTMALNTTIENGGLYTIVLAAVTADGSLVKKTVALDSFYYSGLGDIGSHPCELDIVVGNYTDYNTAEEGKEIGDYNALGYKVTGKDLKELYVGCWSQDFLDEYLAKEGHSYETLFKDEGISSFTLEELTKVHSAEGKTGYCGDLEEKSSYTMVFLAVNDYEESDIRTYPLTTGVAPEYRGELVVGSYLWKYEDKSKAYQTILKIKSYQGSSKRFLVSDLGYHDGSEWFAIYDEKAGTLTLDGTVRGRKKEGNLFGKVFGNINEKTVYLYASVAASGTAGMRNDPFIFTIDKDTKELSGQMTALSIYTNTDGVTGTLCMFDASSKTTIVPYNGALLLNENY